MSRCEVTQVLEATTGGTRRHLLDLVGRLDPRRFSVDVICSAQRDSGFLADIDSMQARGIRVTVVPMSRPIQPVADLVAVARLYRILRKARPAVVHTHSAKAGFLGRVAARMAHVPLIVHTLHTFPFEMEVGRVRQELYLNLERFAARLADRVVCVTPAQKRVALDRALASPEKLLVVPNGVDADLFGCCATDMTDLRWELGAGPESQLVGCIARFAAQKGQRYLVLAAARVLREFPSARFVFVGDGAMRADVERLAQATGVRGSIRFCGSRADVGGLYHALDVVVLPSLWEGLPYTLLEAMSAGRPVLATAVGGMPDAIEDGRTGLLVPPGDADALAARLLQLLRDRTLCARLGVGAQGVVRQRYGIQRMIETIESVYEGRV